MAKWKSARIGNRKNLPTTCAAMVLDCMSLFLSLSDGKLLGHTIPGTYRTISSSTSIAL